MAAVAEADKGVAGGSPVDQWTVERRQYARGRGADIPAQPEDG
jgi:hypothetical protein